MGFTHRIRKGVVVNPNKLINYRYLDSYTKGPAIEENVENYIKFANLTNSTNKVIALSNKKNMLAKNNCKKESLALLECWRQNKMDQSKCANIYDNLQSCIGKRNENMMEQKKENEKIDLMEKAHLFKKKTIHHTRIQKQMNRDSTPNPFRLTFRREKFRITISKHQS